MHNLIGIPKVELLDLLSARARRKFKRGLKPSHLHLIKRLRKNKKGLEEGEKPEIVRTHLRDMIILPEMVASIVGVYDGKDFRTVEIKPNMVGHYLGEFSITYTPVRHGKGAFGKNSLLNPLR